MLTQDRLKELLDYDAETGEFCWKHTKGRMRAGQRAGATDAYGYRVIRVDGVLYKAHRLAWMYAHGRWPDGLLDHANRKPGDNRLLNLREATQSENMHNADRKTKSGVPGVRWRQERGRWVAQIRVGYRNHVIGSFLSKDEAVAARRRAEQAMVSSIYKTGASDE
jgi:hypothetical protein